MDSLCQKDGLLQYQWNGLTLAKIAMFLHDCGKPFVLCIFEKNKNINKLFIGHAQVGARLVMIHLENELPQDEIHNLALIIDSHFCVKRFDRSDLKILEIGNGHRNAVTSPLDCKRLFKKTWYESMDQHSTIACFADQYDIFGSRAQFGYKDINWDVIYEFPDSDIVRISNFCHCKEVTYGPTRYCSGEFALVHNKSVTLLRSGLPTLATTPSNVKAFDHITMTPQIRRKSNQYFVCSRPFQFHSSKICLKTNLFTHTHMQTLNYEIINKEDLKELTVCYPQNVCKFIGCTTFSDGTLSFALEIPNDKYAVEQQAFTTWKACQEYMSEQHNRLFNEGISVDLEGFVLYYWTSERQLLDVVKFKFEEYRTMKNPDKNFKEYKKILSNPIVGKRFQKSRNFTKAIYLQEEGQLL
ncbi:uncharacterized protein CDAR_462111 [Caerostris darwini]|uniref:Uncharacterized protein n=1 Tax=Caerostris darwini TaxID=1538125 RepID=A0AAV4PC51_9ARAC|nr:uncharacterized protein CDAR_462111 [Caerostris darwini]